MTKMIAFGTDECGDEIVLYFDSNEHDLDSIREDYPECRFTHCQPYHEYIDNIQSRAQRQLDNPEDYIYDY